MNLSVLSVAYALAPVRPDTAGGAEHVLATIDAALSRAGHHSLVVACEDSVTAGTLLTTPALPATFTPGARLRAEAAQRACIEAALRRFRIDVIHCHGLDFADHLPVTPVPTLVTLHLPPDHYAKESIARARPGIWFNCVSESQRRGFDGGPAMLPVIENGVDIARLDTRHARRDYVMALGRICPEKGFHHALDAAAIANVPMLLAGQVFPYAAHRRYFTDDIAPRLGARARFIGSIDPARKRRLLSGARCLLVPSLVAETSSLVAMEALACGTPVVAFRAGALVDIVEHGATGYLVDDTRQMADAIHGADAIDRARCRAVARKRFSAAAMIERYIACYRGLARGKETAA